MTTHPLRSAALFVLALVVLSGVAYVVQGSSHSRPPLLVVTPPPVSAPPPAKIAPAAARTTPVSGVPQIDPGWLRRTSQASGIPAVAL